MDGLNSSSGHPPLPPTSEDDLVSRLRLLRSRRVGPATYHRLIREHATAQGALAALPDIAADRGVKGYRTCTFQTAKGELDAGRKLGAQLVAQGSADYPSSLAQVTDAPPLVWVMGNLSVLHRPMVALVGARNASSNGTRMAKKLAHELAEAGIAVVSGLARGVDTAAHLGSLDHGTVAVLAGGVDQVYPEENCHLGKNILAQGARISEQPIGLVAQARHFPRRNRIISGLSQAVIVVEAAAKSGTLITARQALDQGREVLAVPGHPMDPRASGCNMLIRDGATLVRGTDDILALLERPTLTNTTLTQPPPKPKIAAESAQAFLHKPLSQIANLHKRILDRLGPAPTAEDQLVRDLKIPASQVSGALVELEMDGTIERQSGGMVSKIPPN